jgi:hypothetical protein
MKTRFQPPDSHHSSTATGWLGLGNWHEANEGKRRFRRTSLLQKLTAWRMEWLQ